MGIRTPVAGVRVLHDWPDYTISASRLCLKILVKSILKPNYLALHFSLPDLRKKPYLFFATFVPQDVKKALSSGKLIYIMRYHSRLTASLRCHYEG